MISLSEHQFFWRVNNIFGSILQNYGFEIREEGNKLVVAQRGDIELIFLVEVSYLEYFFSLAIKISGELGRKATTDVDNRNRRLDIITIAHCLNPNYEFTPKKIRTEEDLAEVMEDRKEVLIKYCKDMLLGDVSLWQDVVDCWTERR